MIEEERKKKQPENGNWPLEMIWWKINKQGFEIAEYFTYVASIQHLLTEFKCVDKYGQKKIQKKKNGGGESFWRGWAVNKWW